MATSYQYGLTSSAWTGFVKGVFKRHAGVACPPKLLRASFCTFLRAADGVDDELLESCAKCASAHRGTPNEPSPPTASVDRQCSRVVAGP